MHREFEIAGGSIVGTHHLRPLALTNNQDSFYWLFNDKAIIAVVTDGCSSSPHSEVGAKLGARLIAESLTECLCVYGDEGLVASSFWEDARQDVLAQLRVLAKGMAKGECIDSVIRDYLLFSVVGALITPQLASVFSIGDGVFFLNGEMAQIGPFPDNAPPYLAYALSQRLAKDFSVEALKFNVHSVLFTQELDSLLIGTDGVVKLAGSAECDFPGREKLVGPISQFWTNDQYFQNPDQVRRTLALANKPFQRVDWQKRQIVRQPGLLFDDTTLVVVRRRRC